MSEATALTPTSTDEFMGHWFGDWSHGVDHNRCGHCGFYQHSFEMNRVPCAVAALLEGAATGILEQVEEDWGAIWAIRPELHASDIYAERECPDVRQFETREKLLEWLDQPAAGTTNRERRWYGRIAVRELQSFAEDIRAAQSFSDFIKSGPPLLAWPSTERQLKAEIRRTCAAEDPPITCKLDEGWDFDGIFNGCRFGRGYRFDGCEITSFPSQITLVITDLQDAFRKRHPRAPVEAECCFLESWDVLRYVAEFCGKTLARSPEAHDSVVAAGKDIVRCEDHIEAARRLVRVRLAVYAAYLRSETRNAVRDTDARQIGSSNCLLVPSLFAVAAEERLGINWQDPPVTSKRAGGAVTEPRQGAGVPAKAPRSIGSNAAVQTVRLYMDLRGWDSTQFAIQAQTSDRTIRKFLKTGQLRRSIFDAVATAVGVTREQLLRGAVPEPVLL